MVRWVRHMRAESKYLVTILGDETRQENVVSQLLE
jgi:hypothetical protein